MNERNDSDYKFMSKANYKIRIQNKISNINDIKIKLQTNQYKTQRNYNKELYSSVL